MTKPVVFVLGMGRSGTSAITRILSLCGAALPPDLLPANYANEAGYWEPIEALQINDRFLARFGSNWYDPSLKVQMTPDDPGLRSTFIAEIVGFLSRCEQDAPLVIKDPRISALCSYWFQAVEQAGRPIQIVVAVRPPESVAASLATRNGVSEVLSGALWFKYNLLATVWSRGRGPLYVGYDNLLADWRHEVGRITGHLGLDRAGARDTEFDEFLQPKLRHHVAKRAPDEVLGANWIGELNTVLSEAASDLRLRYDVVERAYATFTAGQIDIASAFDEYRSSFSHLS